MVKEFALRRPRISSHQRLVWLLAIIPIPPSNKGTCFSPLLSCIEIHWRPFAQRVHMESLLRNAQPFQKKVELCGWETFGWSNRAIHLHLPGHRSEIWCTRKKLEEGPQKHLEDLEKNMAEQKNLGQLKGLAVIGQQRLIRHAVSTQLGSTWWRRILWD